MKKNKGILVVAIVLIIAVLLVITAFVIPGVIGDSSKQEDSEGIFTNVTLDGEKREDLIDSKTKQTFTFEIKPKNETTVLEYEVKNPSKSEYTDVIISCESKEKENVEIEYEPDGMTIKPGEIEKGSITAKLTNADKKGKNICVTCTLNAKETEKESEDKAKEEKTGTYKLTVDTNDNGIADIGDEIKVGTENFYVISNTDSEINALAKYNLYAGEIFTSNAEHVKTISPTEKGYGIQNKNAKAYVPNEDKIVGMIFFDGTGEWPYENNATIDIKDKSNKIDFIRELLYGEKGYENYVKKTIPNASIRLITYNELIKLGCSLRHLSCEAAPSWVYSTSYWSGSANFEDGFFVWAVYSDGGFYGEFPNIDGIGVRPVITIPKS